MKRTCETCKRGQSSEECQIDDVNDVSNECNSWTKIVEPPRNKGVECPKGWLLYGTCPYQPTVLDGLHAKRDRSMCMNPDFKCRLVSEPAGAF